ncbi:MAG: hypothetical protein Q9214_005197, partial [Letrouitia sp. 1 TL-2023]
VKVIADVKGSPQVSESTQNEGDFQAIDPHSGVKRGLKTRHLSMMALAGIIGPGLLIGSGGKDMFAFPDLNGSW